MCGQGSCPLQAEKNMAWEAQQQQAQAQAQLNALQSQQGTGPCKLLVANINIRIEVGEPCCVRPWWQVLVGESASPMCLPLHRLGCNKSTGFGDDRLCGGALCANPCSRLGT